MSEVDRDLTCFCFRNSNDSITFFTDGSIKCKRRVVTVYYGERYKSVGDISNKVEFLLDPDCLSLHEMKFYNNARWIRSQTKSRPLHIVQINTPFYAQAYGGEDIATYQKIFDNIVEKTL